MYEISKLKVGDIFWEFKAQLSPHIILKHVVKEVEDSVSTGRHGLVVFDTFYQDSFGVEQDNRKYMTRPFQFNFRKLKKLSDGIYAIQVEAYTHQYFKLDSEVSRTWWEHNSQHRKLTRLIESHLHIDKIRAMIKIANHELSTCCFKPTRWLDCDKCKTRKEPCDELICTECGGSVEYKIPTTK